MSDRPFLPPADYFETQRRAEFPFFVRGRALRALDGEAAADRWLARAGAPERVSRLLKAAIPAATAGGDAGFAGDIVSDYRVVVSSFSESLRSQGFFFELLQSGFVVIPMRTRAGVITAGATGYVVGEGKPKPISKIAVANGEITPRKAVAIMVATAEMITALGDSGQLLFERELRNAVIRAVEEEVLGVLLTGVTPIPSSGTDFPAAVADLRALLGGIETRGGPIVLITDRATALAAGLLATPSGGFGFGVRGELAGVQLFVSDAVDPGMLVAVNCSCVAADGGSFDVSASRQAAIEMLDTGLVQDGTTGANLVSLWQNNAVGLKVETFFGLEVIRDNAAAAISNINYGAAAP